MRKQILALLAVALLGADARDDVKKEQAKFKGRWTVLSFENDKGKNPVTKSAVEFTGDMMFIALEGSESIKAAYQVDPGKNPREIDLVPTNGLFKGKTCPGIYDLAGDTLKLCVSNKGPRPKAFKPDAASETNILELKRVKP